MISKQQALKNLFNNNHISSLEYDVMLDFLDYSIISGNEFFISRKQVENFIQKLFDRNVSLLGIEGFIMDKDFFIPQMDLIADFSEFNNFKLIKDAINVYFLDFNKNKHYENTNVYFNFVIKNN